MPGGMGIVQMVLSRSILTHFFDLDGISLLFPLCHAQPGVIKYHIVRLPDVLSVLKVSFYFDMRLFFTTSSLLFSSVPDYWCSFAVVVLIHVVM